MTDHSVAWALTGMTVATYGCRAGGYWLFRRIPPKPWLRDLLGYVPGTLFIGYVVPGIIAGGWPDIAGAAATILAMAASGNFAAAIAAGAAVAWGVWLL
jgi:uncharacterized membrane protein